MPYHINEELSDVIFEVDGDKVAFKVPIPATGIGSDEMWNLLGREGSEQIHLSHIKDALDSYFEGTSITGDSFFEEDENGNIRVKDGKNFYTEGELSAGGYSDEPGEGGGEGGGGIDENKLWEILAKEGTQQIDKSHITTALTGYATEQWVLDKKYLTEATLTEQLSKYVTLEAFNPFKETVEAHISDNNIHLTAEEKEKLSWFAKDKDGNIYVTNGLNFYTEGELSAGGYEEGEGGGGTGNIFGIKVNGSTYKPVDGYITIPDYPTELSWANITGKPSWIGGTKPSYSFSEITGKPSTIKGYGITDAYTKVESDGRYVNTTGDTMTGTLYFTCIYPQIKTSENIAGGIELGKGVFAWDSVVGTYIKGTNTGGAVLANVKSDSLYWNNTYKFIHTGNYETTTDARYVKKSGDTMTGALTINAAKNQILVLNSSGGRTDSYPFFELQHDGIRQGVYGASGNQPYFYNDGWKKIWHAGNDGSGSGLDADLLDGIDSSYFYRDKNATIGASDDWNTFNYNGAWRATGNFNGENAPSSTYKYGLLSVFKSESTVVQIYFPDWTTYNIQCRTCFNVETGGFRDWKSIAFTDSNVASATKLQTPRTIWGQRFDGTANVSGNMTGVGNITTTGDIITNNGVKLKLSGSGISYYYSGGYARQFGQADANGNMVWAIAGINGNGDSVVKSYYGGTYDNPVITILANRNVGFGTISPSYKCHIEGTFYASGAATLGSTLSVAGTFTASNGIVTDYGGGTWISMATRSNIIQGHQNQSTNSAHALYRVKNSNGDAIVFGGLGVSTGFYGFTASRISSGENGYDWATTWDVGTGKLTHNKELAVSGAVTMSSTLNVSGNSYLQGNVSIGTTSSNYKLSVVGGNSYFERNVAIGGTLSVSGASTFTGKTTHNGGIYTTDISGNGSALYLGNSNNRAYVYLREDMKASSGNWSIATSGAAYFMGNVGIKTSSPAYALDVRGDISTNASQYINGIRVYKDTDGYLCIQGNLKITGNMAAAGEVAAGQTLTGLTDFLYDVTSFDSYTSTATNRAPTARAVKLIKDKVSEAATNASNAATKANQAASDISLIDMYLTQITSSTTLDQLKTILMNIAKNL